VERSRHSNDKLVTGDRRQIANQLAAAGYLHEWFF